MSSRQAVLEGVGAGVLAYVVVALFFAVVNLVAGQSPFETAFLMGQALGAGSPGPGEAAGIILAANGIHLVISLGVGVAAALLVMEVEHHHALWYAVLMAFAGGFLLSIVLGGIVGAEVAEVTTWPQIAAANTLGAGVIGAFLWLRHPGLVRQIDEEMQEEEEMPA